MNPPDSDIKSVSRSAAALGPSVLSVWTILMVVRGCTGLNTRCEVADLLVRSSDFKFIGRRKALSIEFPVCLF